MTRVIVSCDSTPLGAAAIRAATALAQRLNAELRGVFVEDVNLMRVTQLPLVRELTSWSATARQLESDAVGNLLEWQARAMREALAKAAKAMRLHWSFEIVRGAPPISVMGVMQEMDLAVFGHASRFSAALSPRLRAAVQHVGSPVMVFYDGTPAADRALSAAQSLGAPHEPVLVITSAVADSVAARARSWTSSHHIHAEFVTLRDHDANAIRQIAQRYKPAALVWSSVTQPEGRETLAVLVDLLPCPVVLVT